ncbi:lytic polysaccharide monooxygenase auxiliary activity family 9 protein [Streptomyces sp. NPDC052042]|uniref:lytic polysaccharide monooxygenase auxiliary activity family 9 protein n=1 Tax=Streptomyces sp. NPDC052042 TaxID=3365683 RepID=UPI0037D3CAAA
MTEASEAQRPVGAPGSHTSHSLVCDPPSRAQIYLADWRASDLESGKFFPATAPGLRDPSASDDVVNGTPPPDGKIASAGRAHAAQLDEARADWQKTTVGSGHHLDITWSLDVPRKSRCWKYFITRDGWDPSRPLARSQFEEEPIFEVRLCYEPYWGPDSGDLVAPNPTKHTISLPDRTGYHVILAVWEIADTGSAFYQVIDVDLR